MSSDNNAIVGQILYEVANGLGPYILKKYRRFYGAEYRQKLIQNVESPFSDVRPFLKDDDAILKAFDAYRWLRAITKAKQVFKDELGPVSGRAQREFNHTNAFSFAHELLDARNTWAHSNMRDQFTNDGVFRIAENAVRLLVAVDAKTHALVAEDMMRRIGRRIYGNYAGDTQRQLKALEQDLESANRKLESTAMELGSTAKRLRIVEQELSTTRLELASAQFQATAAENSLTETRQRRQTVELELGEAKRALKLAEEASQVRPNGQNQLRQSETVATRGARKKRDRSKVINRGESNNRSERKHAETTAIKDFTGQNMAHAQLASRNLAHAILRGVDLSNANLANADLSHADLTQADLTASNLSEASLKGADRTKANLKGAILRRARLMGATLQGAILPDGTEWEPGSNMGSFLR